MKGFCNVILKDDVFADFEDEEDEDEWQDLEVTEIPAALSHHHQLRRNGGNSGGAATVNNEASTATATAEVTNSSSSGNVIHLESCPQYGSNSQVIKTERKTDSKTDKKQQKNGFLMYATMFRYTFLFRFSLAPTSSTLLPPST